MAEVTKVLTRYLADIVQMGLDNGGDQYALVDLINRNVEIVKQMTQEDDFVSLSVDKRTEQLLAILHEDDPRLLSGKTAARIPRPETFITRSSLFTGAAFEPRCFRS